MTDVVYKPPQEYKEVFNTPATKLPLFSTLVLMGLRKVYNAAITRSTAGTTVTSLYTVPAGKSFFLIHGYIESELNDVSINLSTNIIQNLSTSILEIYQESNAAWTTPIVQRESNNFNPPVVFQVGENISLKLVQGGAGGGRNNNSVAIIIGYEIDNTLVPNLI